MTVMLKDDPDLTGPQGHVIGFVKTQAECTTICDALNRAGLSASAITVLSGEDGLDRMKKVMGGSQWGEAAEDVLKQGEVEISHRHLALIIEVEDREQAVLVANTSEAQGGYGFTYFGQLIDERLTR